MMWEEDGNVAQEAGDIIEQIMTQQEEDGEVLEVAMELEDMSEYPDVSYSLNS